MTERRQRVVIQAGGLIELRVPDLPVGETAEVIVRIGAATERVREARDLFASTQALPAARVITEDEIAAEVRSWRTSRR